MRGLNMIACGGLKRFHLQVVRLLRRRSIGGRGWTDGTQDSYQRNSRRIMSGYYQTC